jgi:hypothetical protein
MKRCQVQVTVVTVAAEAASLLVSVLFRAAKVTRDSWRIRFGSAKGTDIVLPRLWAGTT